jgi:uncharacterized protein (DUF2235 family)
MDTPQARRQLVVCCDGTSNNVTGRQRDTNVVKMLDFFAGDPLGPGQVVYYDPGVGNGGMLPGVTYGEKFQMLKDRVAGLALGGGIYENISEGYQFVMREWKPGDQLFFFGFSRGAFTARGIAGLVRKFGILPPHMTALVPTLLHVYFSRRSNPEAREASDAVTNQARSTFAQPESLTMKIHFVGTWDTVASVGIPFFRKRFSADPSIATKPLRHIRQALALDEHRALFEPRIYADPNGVVDPDQTMKQFWFRGAHCDTGGGYHDSECIVSNEALSWLLDEARECDLRLYERGELVGDFTTIQKNVAARCKVAPAPPVVHSQIRETCLWAIAGLWVRETNPEVNGKLVPGVEHPSVAAGNLRFPEDTVWRKARALWMPAIAGVLAAGVFLYLGYVLSGAASAVPEYVQANLRLTCLQLLWWRESTGGLGALQDLTALPHALLADLLFIATYACLLAWFVVRAFAAVAGLNRVATVKSKFLNRLGLALPTAVIADLAENAATWGVFAIGNDDGLAKCVAILMTLASLTKWVALAGVAVLVAWSLKPRAQPGSSP